MSVWDSVLNTVSRITGSAADVSMRFGPHGVMPGEAVKVEIEVIGGRAALDVREIIVDIEANEHVTLKSVERTIDELSDAIDQHGRSHPMPRPASFSPHTVNVFRQRVRVAQPFTLGAGEKKSYSGRFRLPDNAQPTYEGTNVRHYWKIRVRLDILEHPSGYRCGTSIERRSGHSG